MKDCKVSFTYAEYMNHYRKSLVIPYIYEVDLYLQYNNAI